MFKIVRVLALALMLPFAAHAQQGALSFSTLPLAGSPGTSAPSASDQVLAEQGVTIPGTGKAVRISLGQIVSLFPSGNNLPLAGGTMLGSINLSSYPLIFGQESAPATPAAGGALYVDTSNNLHFLSSTGAISNLIANGALTVQQSSSAASTSLTSTLNTGTVGKLSFMGQDSTSSTVDYGDLTGSVVSNTHGATVGRLGANAPTFAMVGSPTLDTSLAGASPANSLALASGGNQISYCPTLSCVTSPWPDHQRASALFWSTTSADGQAEEQTVGIETSIGTGYAKTWATSTPFAVGDNVRTNGNVYRATVAGTSASSGSGPSGTGSSITDGTVTWMWINQSAIDSKVGLYNEEVVNAGGGNSWGQATNVQLAPGMTPTFNVNTELDFSNDSGTDCALGVANCIGVDLNVSGSNQSTTGLYVESTNSGPKYATIWGIRTHGQYLASQSDIEVDSSAPIGLGFNVSGVGSSSHSTASIQDSTNSPISYVITGSHATESISDVSTSPASLNLQGTYSLAAININNHGGGLAVEAQPGQAICLNGTTGSCIKSAGGATVITNASNVTMLTLNGTIQAGAPVQLASYTVAALPTCNAGLKGGMAYVTDATSPTYNGALTGGGSVAVPVFCNGSAWTSH